MAHAYPHTIDNGAGERITFLRRVPGPAGDGPVPDPFDAAFLATRYRSEFTMAVIPAPVRRFVFPVIVAVGTLPGKYRKYADAPEPVRR